MRRLRSQRSDRPPFLARPVSAAETMIGALRWLEPRFLIGPAECVIGVLMVVIAYRLWAVHPLDKVLRLGPYMTPEGLKILLAIRIEFFAFGSVLVVGGFTRFLYWFGHRNVNDPFVLLFGSMEALLSLWAAALAINMAVRLWGKR